MATLYSRRSSRHLACQRYFFGNLCCLACAVPWHVRGSNAQDGMVNTSAPRAIPDDRPRFVFTGDGVRAVLADRGLSAARSSAYGGRARATARRRGRNAPQYKASLGNAHRARYSHTPSAGGLPLRISFATIVSCMATVGGSLPGLMANALQRMPLETLDMPTDVRRTPPGCRS